MFSISLKTDTKLVRIVAGGKKVNHQYTAIRYYANRVLNPTSCSVIVVE